jgi:hypothetical protein
MMQSSIPPLQTYMEYHLISQYLGTSETSTFKINDLL